MTFVFQFLIDGISILINPLIRIFSLIYSTKLIPKQWLIAKITPIHKKGSKSNVEKYRPVASLCSTSKIFQQLILNKIKKLELENEINLVGKQQHGFTKGKSTATAGLLIQSMIARALDDNNLVLLASLDILKFEMYIMCGSLSQINHSNKKKCFDENVSK